MERKFDWEHIEDLKEFNWLPDRYDIEEQNLFRTPLLLINHLYWNQLVDYKFYNQINSTGDPIITVHAYYTAAIHNLRRLKVVEIPANEPFNQKIQIHNFSRLRQNSIKQARLENCIDLEHDNSLKFFIEHSFGVDNLEEYCKPELEDFIVEGDGSVAPYDRVWVAWVIDLIVGIYREDTEGAISLVACNDYLCDFTSMIYPKSNNYWVIRTKEESKNANPFYGYNRDKLIYKRQDLNQKDPRFKNLEETHYNAWEEYRNEENT